MDKGKYTRKGISFKQQRARLGGVERAKTLTPEQRSAIAKAAGVASGAARRAKTPTRTAKATTQIIKRQTTTKKISPSPEAGPENIFPDSALPK